MIFNLSKKRITIKTLSAGGVLVFFFYATIFSRTCSLRIGMNLGGISSESTELPFVDIMNNELVPK